MVALARASMLIANPLAALIALLRDLEAGGFIAVQQGKCFDVAASVNLLPVGRRLVLFGAATAYPLPKIGFDARGEPNISEGTYNRQETNPYRVSGAAVSIQRLGGRCRHHVESIV